MDATTPSPIPPPTDRRSANAENAYLTAPRRELEVEHTRLMDVFRQAPVAIAVLRGRSARDLVYEIVNAHYEELIPEGRRPLGRRLRDVLPEMDDALVDALQHVLDSGETFVARDFPMSLDRDGDGTPETYYFDFIYHPLVETDGTASGVVGVGTEVTGSVRARRMAEELQGAAERAKAEAERSHERMARLQSLTATLGGARSAEDVASVVVAQAVAATGATTGMLAVRKRGDLATIVRQTGLPPQVTDRFSRFTLTAPGPAAQCLRTGEPQWAESRSELLARYPEISDIWEHLGTHAVATIPLVVDDEVVGAMSFTFDEPRRLSAEDREFFLALGRQGAQAIERARLFAAERAAREEAEAAGRRVAFLAEASARLHGSLDVESTLRTVAELAVPTLAEWCFIEVLEHSHVRPAAVAHTNPEMVRLGYDVLRRYPIDLNAPFGSGKVLRTGEPELHPDIPDKALAAVAQNEEHLALLTQVGFRSSLSVPLAGPDGKPVAVLSLVSATSGRRFGEADLAMAEEVARRASAALAAAQLYTAGQSALRRATALQQVSSALVGALTAAEVADVVVHHGRVATGASAGSFARLDDEGRTFDVVSSEGYDAESTRRFARFPVLRGRPLSDAVLENAPVYVSSLREFATRYPEMAPAMQATGFEAFVALPVRADAEIGAALTFSFAGRREFDAEDQAFFETLAAQAGQALARAQLVEAERAARAEAEAARERAEEASRAKGEFLAVMSHELRTPLNAIGGYAQLIEMGVRGPVTSDQRDDLERIRRSQLHLTRLINEVLNYARLESGAVEYDLRPTLIADVVSAAISLVEPQRAAKRLALDISLPEFHGHPPMYLLADRDKLEQILVNLLSNAVKFTPEGRVTVELLDEPDPRGMAVLRVTDTGIGIPADKLQAIFEPFVQVGRSLSKPGEGTGLGLAISRDLARGMGGDLSAESTPEVGSVFTLLMPRA